MGLLSWLFNRNKADCPRCLGKGEVDEADIQRLKKELYWLPGTCAYCNGAGKVSPKTIAVLSADTGYLTTDLSEDERERLRRGDAGALQRAGEFTAMINNFIEEIEHLYYIDNMQPGEIADYLLERSGEPADELTERAETIDYIKKVINSKLENRRIH